jgi:hypothetical protein
MTNQNPLNQETLRQQVDPVAVDCETVLLVSGGPQAGTVSAEVFQNVTSQFLLFFSAQGCVLPIAEELAQKVTGELAARMREILGCDSGRKSEVGS